MTARHLAIASVIIASLLVTNRAIAQAPPAPASTYTGNVGGGLAMTNGNTNTRNVNLTGAIVRDAKTRNVVKGTGSYLRGSQSDILNLDRTAINVRDEFTVSNRTFVFAQNDYVRDQFKEIIFLWSPTAGVGYRLINTDAAQFTVDAGAGGVLEKNPGIAASKSGDIALGYRIQCKLSSTAALTESLSTLLKTNDWEDSLTNVSLGLTTAVSGSIQLKLEFLDSYKNKPPSITVKKNDTAFITTFVVKF